MISIHQRHINVLIVVVVSCCVAADGFTVQVANLECRKLMMKQAKRYLKMFNACTREVEARVKGNEEEFKKQFGCIIKCTMGKDGLLDGAGQVSDENVKKWLQIHVPTEMHEVSITMMSGCLEEYVPQMKDGDAYCSTGYLDYVNCISGLMADYC